MASREVMPSSPFVENEFMIAAALREDIESYARRCRQENRIFCMAAEGSLSKATVTRYIANIHYLIQHTPDYLARARDRAQALGDAPLAKHFAHKLAEEIGHDVWAERDLASLTRMTGSSVDVRVTSAMRRLVELVARIIDEDPALYLSYIAFAEYLIVILGPEWLELLERRCGIPMTSMTVIGNHIELDREHAEEAFDQIDDLVGEPHKLRPMRQALAETLALFDEYCMELAEGEKNKGIDGRHVHVSAA